MRTRYAALAATFLLVTALAATILPTSFIGPQPASAAQQTSQGSPARWPAPPFTPLRTHTLTVTAGPGGSVDPTGTTTHREASEVTLTASWNDATPHLRRLGRRLQRHGHNLRARRLNDLREQDRHGDLHPARRPGAPRRRLQTAPAPSTKARPTTTPRSRTSPTRSSSSPTRVHDRDGRYQVERGQQITVVTAAPLPTGYTRFYLQRTPLRFTTRPTSFEQLLPPIGTTYTFTPIEFEGAAPELTFDLRSAKPRPLPRAGLERPQLGAVAVSTTFLISDPPSFHEVRDAPPSGNTLEPGTYRVRGIGGLPDLILSVPSNHLESNRGTPLLGGFYIAHCSWDDEATANICIDVYGAIDFDTITLRPSSVADPYVSPRRSASITSPHQRARSQPPPADEPLKRDHAPPPRTARLHPAMRLGRLLRRIRRSDPHRHQPVLRLLAQLVEQVGAMVVAEDQRHVEADLALPVPAPAANAGELPAVANRANREFILHGPVGQRVNPVRRDLPDLLGDVVAARHHDVGAQVTHQLLVAG